MGHHDEPSEHPGPDDLAPGWGSNRYTVEGYLSQWSMFTSGLGRQRRGWRARIGWIGAVVLIVLLAGPFAVSALLSWLRGPS